MTDFDSIPPNDPAAEAGALGAAILTPEGAEAVLGKSGAAEGDFYLDRNRETFAALLALHREGIGGDPSLVSPALTERGRLDELGGSGALAELCAAACTADSVPRLLDILRGLTRKRGLVNLAAGLNRAARDGRPAGEILDEFRESVDTLAAATEPADDRGPRLAWAMPSELDEREPESVVDGLLLAGMLNLLHAVDKSGKSIFALELARATLTGRPAFGAFEVRRRGPVLLAALDDPESVTKQRLRLAGVSALSPALLAVLTPGRIDLAETEAFLEAVEADALRLRPALVILDALYLLSPAGEGALNDVAVVRPLMSKINSIAERTGAAVLLIHHDRRDASGFAGSYAIRAMSKHALHLTFPRTRDGRQDEETPRRELKIVSKLMPANRHAFELTGPCAWDYLGPAGEVREADLDARILAAVLAAGGPLSGNEIAVELGGRRVAVLAAAKRLAGAGRLTATTVRQERGGHATRKYAIPRVPEGGNSRELSTPGKGRRTRVPPIGGGTLDSRPVLAPELSGTLDAEGEGET